MALTREQEQGESGRAGEVNVTVTAQFEGKVGETRLRGFGCVQKGGGGREIVDFVNKVWLIWSCQAEEKRQTTDVVKGICMGLM